MLEALAAFMAAALIAVAVHRVPKWPQKKLEVADGTVLKLRGPSAIYRSRIIGKSERGWNVAAPLQRDSYVPLRSGECLTVEATTLKGLVSFRSVIISRDADFHTIEIERPRNWFLTERRQEVRLTGLRESRAFLDGRAAKLLDVSRHGARLLTNGHVARGERVAICLSDSGDAFAGWILDAQPAKFRHEPGTEVRLRFEETLNLSKIAV